jgi:hypothetical protein
LDAINAVGNDPQPVEGPEAGQGGPAAGQAVTTLGKVFEVSPAEANRPPPVRPQEVEQTPEAFHRQYRLGDSSLAVEGPEFVVDATVLAQGGAAQGQAQPGEGGPECGPLGAVEVEQGVVEVEENGAETGQGGLLSAVGDEAALEVVGGYAYGHAVASNHANPELAHLAIEPGQDLVVLAAFDLVVAAGQNLRHHPLQLD